MPTYGEVIWGHIDPWMFLLTSIAHLPPTILSLLREGRFATLFSPSALRAAWFHRFWNVISPNIRTGSHARISALLEGRVSGGAITATQEHEPLSGRVLEIGAGTGLWAGILAKQPGVEKVFGVEPNEGSSRALQKFVKDEGIGAKYVVVPVGVEDVRHGEWDGWRVERGSVDCVVTVLCMCSVPTPEEIAKEVYGYLKEGGRWYVYEHVRADGCGWWVRAYQRFINIFWPRLIGGCQLTRPTGEWLRDVGEWSKVDIARCIDEPWYDTVPHVYGVFTK